MNQCIQSRMLQISMQIREHRLKNGGQAPECIEVSPQDFRDLCDAAEPVLLIDKSRDRSGGRLFHGSVEIVASNEASVS